MGNSNSSATESTKEGKSTKDEDSSSPSSDVTNNPQALSHSIHTLPHNAISSSSQSDGHIAGKPADSGELVLVAKSFSEENLHYQSKEQHNSKIMSTAAVSGVVVGEGQKSPRVLKKRKMLVPETAVSPSSSSEGTSVDLQASESHTDKVEQGASSSSDLTDESAHTQAGTSSSSSDSETENCAASTDIQSSSVTRKVEQEDGISSSESFDDIEDTYADTGSSSDSEAGISAAIKPDIQAAENSSSHTTSKARDSKALPGTSTGNSVRVEGSYEGTSDSDTASEVRVSDLNKAFDSKTLLKDCNYRSKGSYTKCSNSKDTVGKQNERPSAEDREYSKNAGETISAKHPKYSKNAGEKHSVIITKQTRKSRSSYAEENVTYSVNSDSDSSIIEVCIESGYVHSPKDQRKLQSKADLGQTYTISACLQKTDTLCHNGSTQESDCVNVYKSANRTPPETLENRSAYNGTGKEVREEMSSSMTGSSIDTRSVVDTEETEVKQVSIGCNLPGLGERNQTVTCDVRKSYVTRNNDHVDSNTDNDQCFSEKSSELVNGVNNDKDIPSFESELKEHNNNNRNTTVNQCYENQVVSREDKLEPSSSHNMKQDQALNMSERSGFDNINCQNMSHGEVDSLEKDTNKKYVICLQCKTTPVQESCDCNSAHKNKSIVFPSDLAEVDSTSHPVFENKVRSVSKEQSMSKMLSSLSGKSEVLLTENVVVNNDTVENGTDLSEINRILCSSESKSFTDHKGTTKSTSLQEPQIEPDQMLNLRDQRGIPDCTSLVQLQNVDLDMKDLRAEDPCQKTNDQTYHEANTKGTSSTTRSRGKSYRSSKLTCFSQNEAQCSKDDVNEEPADQTSETNNAGERLYLSFARLFSVHTLGEETNRVRTCKNEVKDSHSTLTAREIESNSPQSRRKATRHKTEVSSDKTKGGSLGSGRKGRSRRSNRVLPQQVKEYWHQHLAKYSTVSDRGADSLENLRDITNFDVLRHMGRAKGRGSALCASDGDLNASSRDSHKYSKFTQPDQLACADYVDDQSVCSGLINRWSSNLSLHSDSQLIHESAEKTLAACHVDLHDLSQQEQGECRKEISNKDIQDTHNQSEEVCVNPIKTDIISSERPHNEFNGKRTSDLQVEQKFVNEALDRNDVISTSNDHNNEFKKESLVGKVREKLVGEEFVACDRSNTCSPCSVRSDGTESPSSLTLSSVVSKPPSGIIKKKKDITPKLTQGKQSGGRTGKTLDTDKQNRPSGKKGHQEKKEGTVRKKIGREKDSASVKREHSKIKVKQGLTKSGLNKPDDQDFEAKMLKTLISNTTPLHAKPEDEVYTKQPLSRSWSGNDFKVDTSSEETSPITSKEATESLSASTDMGSAEGVKKTRMRRTMSDLGFTPTRPNRTASLLKNPLMRKHLARTMGLNVDASEDDIKEAIDDKLESTMRQNNLGLGRSCSTISLSSRRYDNEEEGTYQSQLNRSNLCRTTSLSDGMNSFADRTLQSQDNQPLVGLTTAGGNANADSLQTKTSKVVTQKTVQQETVFRTSTVRSVSDRNPSKFQIPSFSDFRKSKRLGLPLKSRSSSCFDCIADETIIEEDIQDTDGKPVFNDVTRSRYNDRSYYRNRGYSLSSINKLHKYKDVLPKDSHQDIVQPGDEVSSDLQGDHTQMDIDTTGNREIPNKKPTKPSHNRGSSRNSVTNINPGALPDTKNTRSVQRKDKILPSGKTSDEKESRNIKFYQEVPPCPSSPDQALGDELEHGLDSDTSLVEEVRRDKSLMCEGENMRARHWKKREHKFRKKFFPDHDQGYVNRSTSDVSDIYAEEERMKGVKEKRQKPYKSDPFGKVERKYRATGFEGDEIKEELLNLVKDVQSCSQQSLESNFTVASSVPSVDSCLDELSSDDKPNPVPPPRRKSKRKKKKKECNSGSVPDKKASLTEPSTEEHLACKDCDSPLEKESTETEATPTGEMRETQLCKKCAANREERSRIISEVLLTENRYGMDLKILQQEFYLPLKTNGLLTAEQVTAIFLNLEELITINQHFVEKLEDLFDTARGQGDQDLFYIDIGKLFLHSTNMLLAFETYCIDHSDALVTLETLEKEKEILRIFLEVSQAENSALRRMHLKAFLMVPVQRIMKYPLLLNRLYKLTTQKHPDRENIKTAKRKIEDILEHINYKTKGTASIRFRKSAVQQLKRNAAIYEDLETHKIAMETVGWNKNEINIVYSGKLLLGNMPDLNATKRNKLVKFASLQAVLLTLGKGPTWETKQSEQSFPLAVHPTANTVKNCALVLLKEKAGTYIPYREPFYLDKCIIAMDEDIPEIFEVQEMTRLGETYVCKSIDHRDTVMWYNHLKYECRGLGKWRKRRNAMPNIMIELGKT